MTIFYWRTNPCYRVVTELFGENNTTVQAFQFSSRIHKNKSLEVVVALFTLACNICEEVLSIDNAGHA